jgi:hypothetical protein
VQFIWFLLKTCSFGSTQMACSYGSTQMACSYGSTQMACSYGSTQMACSYGSTQMACSYGACSFGSTQRECIERHSNNNKHQLNYRRLEFLVGGVFCLQRNSLTNLNAQLCQQDIIEQDLISWEEWRYPRYLLQPWEGCRRH